MASYGWCGIFGSYGKHIGELAKTSANAAACLPLTRRGGTDPTSNAGTAAQMKRIDDKAHGLSELVALYCGCGGPSGAIQVSARSFCPSTDREWNEYVDRWILQSGFYGPLPGAGGVVTLEGGVVRGGDDQFLYSGTLTMLDAVRVQANIRVSAFAPGARSVFGGVEKHFTLNLHGNITGSGVFQVSGPADLPGAPNITIKGTRITALNLA